MKAIPSGVDHSGRPEILHVLPHFRPAFGFGGPDFTSDILTTALSQIGYRVTVWTTNIRGPDGTRIRGLSDSSEGVKIMRYRYVSKSLYRFSNLLLSPGMLIDALTAAARPDLVHLHDFRSFQAAAAHVLCTRQHIPLLLQPHGTLRILGGKDRLKTAYDAILGTRLAKRAARILVLSESEAADCSFFGITKEKIALIPNGVPLPTQQVLLERGRFRREYGIGKDAFVILFMGRIRESKGVFLLVNAMEMLTKVIPNALLVMCGPDDGAMKQVRLMAVEKGVRLLLPGLVTGKKKAEAFVDADVFCLPSFFEMQSVALLEAASFELPIVASPDNVPKEFLTAQAGMFVKLEPSSLSECLLYLANSDSARKELGRRSKATVEKHFRIDRVVEELSKLYSEVLENG